MAIKSAAASSEDFDLRGMWLRMWSSISSAIRLLMAPARRRAAEHVRAPFVIIQGAQGCLQLANHFLSAANKMQFFSRSM